MLFYDCETLNLRNALNREQTVQEGDATILNSNSWLGSKKETALQQVKNIIKCNKISRFYLSEKEKTIPPKILKP